MTDLARKIILPAALTKSDDKYRHLYAAMEAVRLKHNTRAGDLGGEAVGYRTECRKIQTSLFGEILKLRPSIAAKDFESKNIEEREPNQPRLKAEGYADYKAADVKSITGVDLDTLKVMGIVPPDPLENFTGFTETDPNSNITVAENAITVVSMRRDANAYVYKDYGVDHFATGLEHDFKIVLSAVSPTWYAFGGFWAITNTYGSYATFSSGQCTSLSVYRGANSNDNRFQITNTEGDIDSYNFSDGAYPVTFYVTVDWATATGISAYLYSDSARTTLVDTIASSMVSGRKYRYQQSVFSRQASGTMTVSFVVSDLDLKEVAPTTGNRRRRSIICGAA